MDAFMEGLQGDLSREYAAVIQYKQHASVLEGSDFAFAKELLDHANDELHHADLLNDLIVFNGGIPSVTVSIIFTATLAPDMFRQDLEGENEAITRYKERIKQALDTGNFGAVAVLLGILKDEEHHANDLESILFVS
jgi:bacterioferritin